MSTVHDSAVCPHCGGEYEYLFDCKTWETDVMTLCKCQRELQRLRKARAKRAESEEGARVTKDKRAKEESHEPETA